MEEKDENLIKEPHGRKLTKAESIRIKQFALTAADLEEKGYKLHNLTVSTVKANVLGIVAGCVLALPFVLAFHFTTGLNNHIIKPVYLILCPLAMIVSIVVHELLHGAGWLPFTKGKFKSIAFGVIWEALMPYCTCKEALRKGQYLVGLVMPLLILGIIPSAVALVIGSFYLLVYGVVMIICAGGDILILFLILKTKLKGDVLFVDHPSEVGLAAFVKEEQ